MYNRLNAVLSLPEEDGDVLRFAAFDTTYAPREDTIVISIDGHDMILMNAVLDEESGEMVAAQELKAAVVSARFRNVAERRGKVDLEFRVTVPKEMLDARWQLRFYPEIVILGDTLDLDGILITGCDYRKNQLKGYEQYARFLSRIVGDTTRFIDVRNLEIFLQRNLPQVFAYREDDSFVTDEMFENSFGVNGRMAVEHYTDKFAKSVNARRKGRSEDVRRRRIKSPIVTEKIRLDTVITGPDEDMVYNYVHTVNTGRNLKKAEILLSGEIYESDRRLYSIPESDPLTFYISSLSSFADTRLKYKTRVLERKVEANAAWFIDFNAGESEIDENLSANRNTVGNIRMNLRRLLENRTFDLDSITITSFASPEGAESANDALAERRAENVVSYFNGFIKSVRDSITRDEGIRLTIGSGFDVQETPAEEIRFISKSGGENWALLDNYVENDSILTDRQKERYRMLAVSNPDPDQREKALSGERFYERIKNEYYPLLRTVEFDFFLHRKGMVKDTVHTTVVDSTYMEGVQSILDRDYERALKLLAPYNDYNTAIALVSLDRNASATEILEKLPRTARVNYMLAVLYARKGDIKSALECYLSSCSQEPSYIHRGNLDPEIAELIRKYGLNQQ